METAIPPDLPASPRGGLGEKTAIEGGEKIEEGQKEIGEMSRNETSEEVSTCRTEEMVKDISMGKEKEVSEVAWALVSPGKAGRSQTNNPKENDSEILISASKYSVLSANEEEEVKEKRNQW
ncbi:hypothetical protein DY000_02014687 [Brassica cretica]|uniref:Uncharacterized protein n=1 Tax=Brassica cretica TaxID=69181 RepID=A0ABQ7CWK3_BRACR|nr:hypothetical protein DY000_02014687 [Brassica cretica]